jgi:hypothetical protein
MNALRVRFALALIGLALRLLEPIARGQFNRPLSRALDGLHSAGDNLRELGRGVA